MVDRLFILNVVSTVSMIKFSVTFAYITESFDLWHGRLGHVNMASIKKLRNMQLITIVGVFS